jgi:GNAT superfamily N-acetyltransferase
MADDSASIGFLERRGFVESDRFHRYELELPAARSPSPPDGVELAWLVERPGVLQGMYEVAAATYPELGGYLGRQAETLVEWQVYELGSSDALFELTPVAVAGGEVVGFATLRKLSGDETAELRMVCVLPGWRRRGIARALLGAQLAAAHDHGFRRLVAWLRESGPAGLYRSLGFEPAATCIVFRGPLV